MNKMDKENNLEEEIFAGADSYLDKYASIIEKKEAREPHYKETVLRPLGRVVK